jgi:WD40 repeat protein
MLRGSRDEAQLYACFSPDGKWLASAGADGVITLWEVAGPLSGASPVALLEGHVGKCYSLHFRHDSRLLVSGGEDGSVRVWKVGELQGEVPQIQEFQIERPYERMKITGVTGLTAAQLTSLETLGATR